MDVDFGSGAPPSAHEYVDLNDGQLRIAIGLTEQRLRRADEDHAELQRAYREELEAMRRQLIGRFLRRIVVQSGPVSSEKQQELRRRFRRRVMRMGEIARVIRAASSGRTERLDALTEIEAMALLLRLDNNA